MDYYKAKRSPNYDLEDFLQLRKNPQAYLVFFKHFIKCITRKSVFENNIRTAKTYDDICTISDEAFALLLLENSWHRWMDIHTKDSSALLPRRGSRPHEKVKSMIPTKYTKGGYKYDLEGMFESRPTSYSRRKGWSTEGIQRYNELYDQVEADRQAYPEFLKALLTEIRNDNQAMTARRTTPPNKAPTVTARHNLFRTYTDELTASPTQLFTQGSKLPASPQNPFVEQNIDSEEEYEDNENRIGQQKEV